MTTNPELEVTQPSEPESSQAAVEILARVLKNASQLIFIEGHVPNAKAGIKIYGLDVPRATREDIENFVRASGNPQVVEKLNRISQKNREDYARFGQSEDSINYSISLSEDYAYRGTYTMSHNGARLLIRRIPKDTPNNVSNDSVSPGNQLDAESPTSQLLEP